MLQQPLTNFEIQEVAKKIAIAILTSDVSNEASIVNILNDYILLPKYKSNDNSGSNRD